MSKFSSAVPAFPRESGSDPQTVRSPPLHLESQPRWLESLSAAESQRPKAGAQQRGRRTRGVLGTHLRFPSKSSQSRGCLRGLPAWVCVRARARVCVYKPGKANRSRTLPRLPLMRPFVKREQAHECFIENASLTCSHPFSPERGIVIVAACGTSYPI